jgi:sugar/nucleoside kinase (ribokinase family)
MDAPEVIVANPFLHPDLVVYPPPGSDLVPGSVLMADRQELRLGAGAYTGMMLMTLGHTVAYLDAVGSDVFGRFTVDELERLGHDTDLIDRYEGDHMVVVSVADEHSAGGTMIGTCPTAWQRSYDELSDAIARSPSPQVIYTWSWYWSRTFPGLFATPSSQLMRIARQKAALTMLDPNWKPPEPPPAHDADELRAALEHVDILKLNERDARILVGDAEPASAVRELLVSGPRIVVLTLGQDGCVVGRRDDPVVYHIPALAGRPRDTTGAGDYFGGAFLHSAMEGHDPLAAGAFAIVAAGMAIQRPAGAPLPTPDEIEQEAASVARSAIRT